MGIALVYTVHDVLPHDSSDRYRQLFRKIYRQMDALICHTSEAKNQLVNEFAVYPDRVWLIPHGPLFHDGHRPSVQHARARLGIPEGVCIVLWQGILRPYKGLDFLLEAWSQVHRANLSAGLIVAGPGSDPSMEEAMRQKVATLEIQDSVQLDLKYIPVGEIPTYYQAADILVYPYREATTSGALMTGLSYQKPIVATSLPCFVEVLEVGDNAAIVDYGDVEGLAATLKRLILDPAERSRLTKAVGGETRNRYSWSEIARQTRQCYDSILDCRAAKSGPSRATGQQVARPDVFTPL
jgi:glycosyltransferase involved in cell wall biosynthesis